MVVKLACMVYFSVLSNVGADKVPSANRPSPCRAQEGLQIDGAKFPKLSKGLSLCHQYRDCTCCNSSHTALMQYNLDNVLSSMDVTPKCRAFMTMLTCRVCDPEVGVGGKQALCDSTCNDWYDSCKKDYFAFTTMSQLLQLCDERQLLCSPLHELTDGREMCQMAGYKTSRSACFNGRKSSSHDLCSHAMVDPDEETSSNNSTMQTIGMICLSVVFAGLVVPRIFMRVGGFSRAAALLSSESASGRRTRGIGSNDPDTDPYYSAQQDKYLD